MYLISIALLTDNLSRFTIFFFFNDTATTEIYTLSLHDALPIFAHPRGAHRQPGRRAGCARRRNQARHPPERRPGHDGRPPPARRPANPGTGRARADRRRPPTGALDGARPARGAKPRDARVVRGA